MTAVNDINYYEKELKMAENFIFFYPATILTYILGNKLQLK